ncbi:hypothetical protein [Schleiferilactobacillus shenzhenensis]|nr:hypothetical protein [Schleiferilactobacillus shenzhenensis]
MAGRSKEVAPVKDVTGKVIKKHDVVVNDFTHEVMLIVESSNSYGVHGLAVKNNIAGIGDWLDVYPDGELRIVGNAETSYEGD